jgi:GSCFA family
MDHPYRDLPPTAFWHAAVAGVGTATLAGIYKKKFAIGKSTGIVTAGSCFAQHIGRYLREAGYRVLDCEPAPRQLSPASAGRYGHGLFSGRYGNIYTVRQLAQLVRDAGSGQVRRADVWQKDGRFFDALRPGVEPDGLASAGQVLQHRRYHLGRCRLMFAQADLFIFTLGLTEAWADTKTGTIYPSCPGVIAGQFNDRDFKFVNFEYSSVLKDLRLVRRQLRKINPRMKFLLTVSPVPLTATASGGHVLPATVYSKAVLRAVAGDMARKYDDVDYFPSFEIITSPAARGRWYAENLRSVTPDGVAAVMAAFFAQHDADFDASDTAAAMPKMPVADPQDDADDPVCEEYLLRAFGRE